MSLKQCFSSALSTCVNPHVFYFIPGNVIWLEAQKYCRQNHSDLATVDQTDYDELLKTALGDFKGEIWIGLYRKDANAPWLWSVWSKSTFRLWDSGQRTTIVASCSVWEHLLLESGMIWSVQLKLLLSATLVRFFSMVHLKIWICLLFTKICLL